MFVKKLQDEREIVHLGCPRKPSLLNQVTFEILFDLLKRGMDRCRDRTLNDPFLPQQGHNAIQSGAVITAGAIPMIA
jgi:hypothetical protein